MKNYKDFLESKKQFVQEQVEESVSSEPEILELEDLPNYLGEEQNLREPMDPPAVLIMRRKSVRQYPNNQRVALYFVDKINKYVTVPYTAMQWSSTGIAEEKNIIDQINTATCSMDATKLVFENGSMVFINQYSAKQMMKLYNSLNEEHKKEFIEIAGKSKEDFLDIQNFAKQN